MGSSTSHQTAAFTRRQAMIAGGLGTIGLSLPRLLSAERPSVTEKSVILVVPWGGPSQLDTFDPKPEAPSEIRSIFKPIRTKTIGLTMGERLPRLAAMSDRFAVLRAISHRISTHNPATHLALTGHPPTVTNLELTKAKREDFPTLGSVLAKLKPSRNEIPSYVQLPLPMIDNGSFTNGQNAGFLGSTYDPLVVTRDPKLGTFDLLGANPNTVGRERIDERRDLLEKLDGFASRMRDANAVKDMSNHYSRAYSLLRSAASVKAFDASCEPVKLRDRYGPGIGQSLLVARRLVEAGVRLVLVADTTENTNGKWDTHSGYTKPLPEHLTESDHALSALLDDLHDRGLIETTIVAWMAEFGRTPKLKPADGGREHWPHCYSALLAGGGIRGGVVHGSSDSIGGQPRDGKVEPADILATIYHLLGVPLNAELHDPFGRPMALCRGEVIRAII